MNATLHYLNTKEKFSSRELKKIKKTDIPFQNGSQITDFQFEAFQFRRKFENHFPKGIFQLNLAHNRRL